MGGCRGGRAGGGRAAALALAFCCRAEPSQGEAAPELPVRPVNGGLGRGVRASFAAHDEGPAGMVHVRFLVHDQARWRSAWGNGGSRCLLRGRPTSGGRPACGVLAWCAAHNRATAGRRSGFDRAVAAGNSCYGAEFQSAAFVGFWESPAPSW